jgi:hypothetical protein
MLDTMRAIQLVDIQAVHKLTEGPVYLWISELPKKAWQARIRGCQVDSGKLVASWDDAVAYNEATFCALFPEHRCSSDCLQFYDLI